MFQVGNQTVFENLPAHIVDLGRETVIGWGVVERASQLLDDVVESGTIEYYANFPIDENRTELRPVKMAWAKSKPYRDGFNIIIDTDKVTDTALSLLFLYGILDNSFSL
jgi:hypothetical protein